MNEMRHFRYGDDAPASDIATVSEVLTPAQIASQAAGVTVENMAASAGIPTGSVINGTTLSNLQFSTPASAAAPSSGPNYLLWAALGIGIIAILK